MVMFTYVHVVATYRSKTLEAVTGGQLRSLVMPDRSLEPHQEGIREDFSGNGRREKHGYSQAFQPHVIVVAAGG